MGGKNRRTESEINGPGISIFWKIFVLAHPPILHVITILLRNLFIEEDFQYFVSNTHSKIYSLNGIFMLSAYKKKAKQKKRYEF